MPPTPPPRLPAIAVDLRAALSPDADALGRGALAGLTRPRRTSLKAALEEIGRHAGNAAAALLADADPDNERLGELLTVRAWLLAVACGCTRLAGSSATSDTGGALTSPGGERLRRRYQDDLAGAYADGVLPLIDDLIDL